MKNKILFSFDANQKENLISVGIALILIPGLFLLFFLQTVQDRIKERELEQLNTPKCETRYLRI
jgi:hypothetical protein